MATHVEWEQQTASRPPGAWRAAHRLKRSVQRRLDRILHVEASSGVLLLFMAALALLWANSRWGEAYAHLWHTEITVGAGSWMHVAPLHFLVNDGLMTVFFLLVGLEIRREMHEGELADVRRATLPIAAAVGGMLVPAALFLLLTRGAPDRSGWGVPMATDIAFAIGVLAVLGKRVPPALRVLLLALAIIDDIGAILVIAIFYSSKADPAGFAIAAAGVALVLLMQRIGVRRAIMYVPAGFLVWLGALRAGVHPTVAGVILGLMTPVSTWKSHESASPLVRLQKKLHVPVAFGIMPLFAFANAGVRLDGVTLSDASKPVLVGIIAGLVLGKPLGVVGATLLTTKLGIARLPEGVSMRHVVLLGIVAGIGFTMALFIGDLAYRDAELAAATKLAVLIASAAAGVLAIVAGRRLCRA